MSMTQQELETLVDPETIRRSIKRIFTNTANEILGELFQNSQRACASRVEVRDADGGFSYWDNGNGLEQELESFHTLLAMAKSYFANSTITDQDPMGLGIHALLAHDDVTEVTFTSGDRSLKIDTHRWWNEPSYYKTWHERVEIAPRVNGFRLDVRCGETLLKGIHDSLQRRIDQSVSTTHCNGVISAAAGYEGILTIEYNGTPVDTRPPAWCRPVNPLFRTEYQDNELTVGTIRYQNTIYSSVNWYGQIIPVNMANFHPACGQMQFFLNVTKGHPVNPMSPSRRGLVEDEALRSLVQWCVDKAFSHYLESETLQADPGYLSQLFRISENRAKSELPTFLAQPVSKISDLDIYPESFRRTTNGDTIVLRYGQRESVVVNDEVIVLDEMYKGVNQSYPYGLQCFAEYSDRPLYLVTRGNLARAESRNLGWRPGPAIDPAEFPNHEKDSLSEFCLPGHWCLLDDDKPGEMYPLPEDALVFVFDQQDGTKVRSCQWVIGTRDPIAFLNSGSASFGWDNEAEGVYDSDDYDASVSEWKREILGNLIRSDFKMEDLQQLFPTPEHVVSVQFLYHEPIAEMYRPWPEKVVVTSNLGNVVTRTID